MSDVDYCHYCGTSHSRECNLVPEKRKRVIDEYRARRERIATAVLAGLVCSSEYNAHSPELDITLDDAAHDAVRYADALIKRLDE